MYPTHLRYTKEHEWIDPTNPARARIGITDHAQSELGDIVGFELPEVDARFEQNATFGVVESVKAVSDLFMPVAGRVVSVNSVNARRVAEDQRVADWEDAVWLSFDPTSAILLTE